MYYNRIAAQSLERLAALSDGIFGVAMTLLMLDLRSPAVETVHSEQDLWHALLKLTPSLVTYLMSFLSAGIFWISQQTQFNNLERSDRNYAWIHIAFLFAVTLLPFSTGLLAAFITYRTALIFYWFNILLLGMLLFWAWIYAERAGLLKEGTPPEVSTAIRQRVITAQWLYAVGALLCFINTYWSIGFIVLIQLNYALGLVTGVQVKSSAADSQ